MLKKVTTLAVLALAGYGVFRAVTGGGADLGVSDDPGLIDERLWVERVPADPREYVHMSAFMDSDNMGVFLRGSAYDIRLELFEYKRDKGSVRLKFPQSGRSTEFTFSIKTCSDMKPFDLCLDLSSNPWGGPKRYYAFSNPDDEKQKLGSLASSLSASASEVRARLHAKP
jgi:hypothetical protein